jgi:hypothetical protein
MNRSASRSLVAHAPRECVYYFLYTVLYTANKHEMFDSLLGSANHSQYNELGFHIPENLKPIARVR